MRVASKLGILASAVGVVCMAAMPASAQRLGTYAGTTADGNAINFSVGVDATTGKHAVTFLGLNFTALCSGTGEQVGTGLGAGFSDGVDILNSKATLVVNLRDLYTNVAMKFDGQGSISGNVYSILPAFNPAIGTGARPTKTQLCTAARQSFTATFQNSNMQTGPVGTVTLRELPQGVARPAPPK